MGSPQTRSQKHFVSKFFEPLYIYNNNTKYFSALFNNDAELQVMVPNFGLFPTATSAFLAFRDPTNEKYVYNLEMIEDLNAVHNLECNERDDWEKIRVDIMYMILKLKFQQHDTIRSHLLNTGLRPIICRSTNIFWGQLNDVGFNMLGKLLMKLRKELYLSTKI